jgi:hypothetical protein
LGGREGNCLFIDAKGTNLKKRLMAVAEHQGIEPLEALKRVHHVKPSNTEEMNQLLDAAPAMMAASCYSLIIVDFTKLFR